MRLRWCKRVSSRSVIGGRLRSAEVPDSLDRPAAPSERAVSRQNDGTESGEDDESDRAEYRRVDQSSAGRGAAYEDDRQRKDRKGQETPHPQQRERSEAAHRGPGVLSAGGQHPELHGGAHRSTAGHDQTDGVAGQLGGDQPGTRPWSEAPCAAARTCR